MKQLLDQIKEWRRHLHTIPEIGFQEYKTSAYLYEQLEKMGYQPQKITETGIAVYLDFHKEKTIAFRSDIDALEITEQTGVEFKSTYQGKMHACGHDGHMAALLGLAYKLKDVKDLPNLVKKSLMEHHQLFVPVFLKNTMLKEFMDFICFLMLMLGKLLVVKDH